jgi:alpha-glucosidase
MVNPNYRQVNVEHELADPSSVLQYYKKLITLRRKTPALVGGDVSFLPEHRWIMSYRRQLGGESYVVVLNLSRFPKRSRTVVHGAAVLTTSGRDQVNGQLKLAPYEALVVRE